MYDKGCNSPTRGTAITDSVTAEWKGGLKRLPGAGDIRPGC